MKPLQTRKIDRHAHTTSPSFSVDIKFSIFWHQTSQSSFKCPSLTHPLSLERREERRQLPDWKKNELKLKLVRGFVQYKLTSYLSDITMRPCSLSGSGQKSNFRQGFIQPLSSLGPRTKKYRVGPVEVQALSTVRQA